MSTKATVAFTSPEAALGLACDLGTLADWTAPVDEDAVKGPAVAMALRWGWEASAGPCPWASPEATALIRELGLIA